MSGIIRAMRIDLIPLRSYLGLLSGLIALIIAFMGWISPDAMAGAMGGLPVFVLFIVGMQRRTRMTQTAGAPTAWPCPSPAATSCLGATWPSCW